jgi:hypothetical protein
MAIDRRVSDDNEVAGVLYVLFMSAIIAVGNGASVTAC